MWLSLLNRIKLTDYLEVYKVDPANTKMERIFLD